MFFHQAPHYPEFAKQNTYGIQTVSDPVAYPIN